MKNIGVISMGVKMPIFKEGDNLKDTILKNIIETSAQNSIPIENGDIFAVTESIVARAEGNYVTVDDIAQEVVEKFGENATVGVLWPMYSRNRFSMILKGIARGAKKVVVQINNGKDEKGNDIYNMFTGIDIEKFYTDLIKGENAECKIYRSNDERVILAHTENIIIGTVHTRFNIRKKLEGEGCDTSITLDALCNKPSDKHGYNEDYGLLGSNKATEEKLKLFPKTSTCKELVDGIQKEIKELLDKDVEVLIYGDGCFKDPVCGIWEFADPVVSPYSSTGLVGTPNELKIKFLADNEDLTEEEIRDRITNKDRNLKGQMVTEGTTPRRYTDLLGSLADLTSGSGDRGTPVVWIKNYFTNFSHL